MTYTEQSVDIVRETDAGEWRFSKALCKGCGLCIEVCEPHALGVFN
jgi:Pyruvate/2-oxoacid:ferredoxin oxidoreductase delta subunit